MKRQEKDALIQVLSEKIKGRNFYITDSSPLSVAQITRFRGLCRAGAMEYQVVRNTFLKRSLAAQESPAYAKLLGTLNGPSAILFVPESVAVGAKTIQQFRRENGLSHPVLKGAYVGGEVYVGDAALETLASVRSRDEMVGEVISLLRAPALRVLSSLARSKHLLANIVQALSKNKS